MTITVSGRNLTLDRCPHCRIDQPNLEQFGQLGITHDFRGDPSSKRVWVGYRCLRCGGVVLAYSNEEHGPLLDTFPWGETPVDDSIPERAREFLRQAVDTQHSPAASVMVAASAVDAMLKAKGLTEGTLNARIDVAAEKHLITPEMAKWAHRVRLDANDQRHADEKSMLPTESDARRSITFTRALGDFLFVLPSKVDRGLLDTNEDALDEAPSA